ncbi:MAG: hypothetical protein LUQ07_06755 [Methanospirillum sp.]|nr:hypothetical protein [Methanospirillum sp.]
MSPERYVLSMIESNEYEKVLETLYNKSLILENVSDFHPVLGFWYFDALAHLDYTISLFAYNPDSPRNLLSREFLKFRTDEAQKEPYSRFGRFMVWLKTEHPEEYEKYPLFIQNIYDPNNIASYRSFRITLDPDSRQPIPSQVLRVMVDETFDKAYLASVYKGSTIAGYYTDYCSMN